MNKRLMKVMAMLLTVAMIVCNSGSFVYADEEEVMTEFVQEASEEGTDNTDESVIEAYGDSNEISNEEDTEPEVTDQVEVDLPDGVPGMPDGFELTDEELEVKQDAVQHDIVSQLENYSEGKDYIGNQVFCLADSEEYGREIAEAYGAKLAEYTYGVAILDLTDSGLSVSEAVALGADTTNNLPLVEPNYLVYVEPETEDGSSQLMEATRPGDVLTTGWEDWYYAMDNQDPLLQPNDPNYQWWHDMVDTYGAWGMLDKPDLSGSGITVAVIDTGVNVTHEELNEHAKAENVAAGATPSGGHGSHVAGIIAASANNGKGGVGVAPGVQIMALNCANSDGTMPDAYIVSCIEYAADNGAKVINMSLGGPEYTSTELAAVKHAYEKGVTICASTGNDTANAVKYPAAYTGIDGDGKVIDYVIGVAAVRQDGALTTFSTYGNDVTDISAPGADMMSSYTGGSSIYEKEQGTSMSCPVVAGACALYMSVMGAVDPATMKSVLTKSATKSSSAGAGAGILNVAKMFEGDTTAPTVELKSKDDATSIGSVDSGTKGLKTTIPTPVPKSAKVFLSAGNYAGDETANKNTRLIYTTDGKAPAVKNGQITYGTEYTGAVTVSDLIGDATSPVKITVKAAAITGMGVISKVSTLIFTVDPQALGNETVTILNAPSKIVAGKSVTLQAEVTSDESETVSQKVKWTVDSEIGATIKESTGVLTTKTGKTGNVTVTCTSADGKASDSKTVEVIAAPADKNGLASTIILSSKNVSLLLGGGPQTVSVTAIDNKAKESLLESVSVQWVTSNASIAAIKPSPDGKSVEVIPRGKGSATITAKAMDGSEKTATFKANVSIPVSSVSITGQDYIIPGTSATYKASVLPTNAGNKGVNWTFEDGKAQQDDGKVTISSKGVVKVLAGAANRTYTVKATAVDGSGKSGEYSFTIMAQKAKDVTVSATATDSAYQIVKNKSGTLSSVQLFTVNATSSSVDERKLEVSATVDSGITPTWTSSKPGIVTVEGDGNTVTLKAKSAGTAKITCMANDGSKKSTSFNVKVIVPVSDIMLTNATLETYANSTGEGPSFSTLAYGTSNQTKATLGDAYGKPTITKLSWDYKIVQYSYDEDINCFVYNDNYKDSQQEKLKKVKLYTFSNGKVSINKNFESICNRNYLSSYDNEYKFAILIRATATDGSGVYAEKLIVPTIPVARLTSYYRNYTLFAQFDDNGMPVVTYSYSGPIYIYRDNKYGFNNNMPGLKVVSSNPGVANGFYEKGKVHISTGKVGTAKLTVTAIDGTNKSTSFTVKVIKAVESITINGPTTIKAGKAAKYTATVLPKDAANKSVYWWISGETSEATAALNNSDKNGKVSINSKTGSVTVGKNVSSGLRFKVHANAGDGSGITSSYDIEIAE